MRTSKFLAVAVAALALAGCDSQTDSTNQNGSSSPPESSAANADDAQAVPVSDHNYQIHEDGAYGYPTALSEDDKKAGKSSGDMMMFRYLGERDGVYTLQDADHPEQKAECHNPCQDVKFITLGEVVSRSEFNESSVIGSAFDDAFNGKLDVYKGISSSSDSNQSDSN